LIQPATPATGEAKDTKMEVRFIAQPEGNAQLGTILGSALEDIASVKKVTIVSAFASRTTVMRLKKALLALHAAEAKVRIVVGVDMGGTSKEVLTELAAWPVEVLIFKNKKSGVTFHPKMYLVEKASSAEILVGSNNLTDGGFFKNYEAAAHVTYALPADRAAYLRGTTELAKFLAPTGPVVKRLDQAFLQKLVARADIPSEAEARVRARKAKVGGKSPTPDDTFGFEPTPGAKALPVEFQEVVLSANAHQSDEIQKKKRAKSTRRSPAGIAARQAGKGALLWIETVAQLFPTAFYMELNATKGTRAAEGKRRNIPGEQRIPLGAIWSAKDFWGWPSNYEKSVNPRKGPRPATSDPDEEYVDRVYYNWRPTWEIAQIGDASRHIPSKPIRMYYYDNSSDFRFTSGDIADWGEPGDIVKIERVEDGTVEYRCQLAKQGTAEHDEWSAICKAGGHTERGYGFS